MAARACFAGTVTPVPASGLPLDEQAWALFAGAADNPANRRAIIDLATGNRLTSVWLDQMVATSLATSTRDAFAAYLGAWEKGDFHERIRGNPVPVQVIVGEQDPAMTANVMRRKLDAVVSECDTRGTCKRRPLPHGRGANCSRDHN
jgi:hypothetical protein